MSKLAEQYKKFCDQGLGYRISLSAKPRLKRKLSTLAASSAIFVGSLVSNVYAENYCKTQGGWTSGAIATNNNCMVTKENFNPEDSDNYWGAALASGPGEALTINGNLSDINNGKSGISQLDDLGNYDPATKGQTKFVLGGTQAVRVTDNAGQSYTINVYQDSSFIVSDWGNEKVLVTESVGDQQYVSSGFGKAENGGHIDINFDDFRGNNKYGDDKTVYLALKDSNLTWADGSGSVVEWHSKNSFESRAYYLSDDDIINRINVPEFPHSFTDYKGEMRTINSIDDLKAYNRELIAALQSKDYPDFKTQQAYNDAFNKANPKSIEKAINGPGSDYPKSDEIFKPMGNTRAMYASNGGKIIVKSGGQIDTEFDEGEMAGTLVAEGGSIVEVESGAIVSSRRNSTIILGRDGLDGAGAHTVGTNNGVVNSGFRESRIHDTTKDSQEFSYGTAVEAFYGGTIENNGIINVAGNRGEETAFAYSNGFYLYKVGTGTNNGIINIGVNNDPLNGRYVGVAIESNYSKFTNSETGVIYIGRAAQYDTTTPEETADTSNSNNAEFYGIRAYDKAEAINNGKIIIGSKMQNASAMAGDVPTDPGKQDINLKLINNGTIIINGAVNNGSQLNSARNFGMKTINNGLDNEVTNNGLIELNGYNGVGVYVLATSGNSINANDALATLTKNSVIKISSPTQNGPLIRNYGVWVEGRPNDMYYARAKIDGTIELAGDGAVGVYVKDGGQADVTEHANPQFVSGKQQIGFYVYGVQSKIVNSTKAMNVTTAASNLFRIDGGASFLGQGEELTASGENSVILEGAGRASDTASQIITKDAKLTVTGKGAAAVLINGGAYGEISEKGNTERQIYLSGEGAIGGIVDGRYHRIDATYTEEVDLNTKLVNYAKINTDSPDVTGFIARNSGLLVNYGVISMTNTENATGIHVIEGGRLENHGDITVSNGVGLHIEGLIGTDTRANVANVSTITVNDGKAGIYLEKNAFLNATGSQGKIIVSGSAHGVLLNSDAKGIVLGVDEITISAGGNGNGVENNIVSNDPEFAAEIAFKQATINVEGSGSGIRTAVGLVTHYLDENNVSQVSNVTINVGANGVGYDLRNANLSDPVLQSNAVIGPAYTINASDHAIGLRTNTSGEVTNQSTVLLKEGATGTAWLAGTASKVQNDGVLDSKSANGLLVDLANRPTNASSGTTFINTGQLTAQSATSVAVRGSELGDTFIFTNSTSNVRGLLKAGKGSDSLIWSGGRWEGGFDMGEGDNDNATISGPVDTSKFNHALAGQGNNKQLTLQTTTITGGSFNQDDLSKGVNFGADWNNIALTDGTRLTLTDNVFTNGDLDFEIGKQSTLIVDHTKYRGTDEAPTLYSEADVTRKAGTLALTNNGLIDMGNKTPDGITDKLVIKGNYHSDNGSIRLNSSLGNDGAPSDMVVIDGGTVSGTTTLFIDDLSDNTKSAITKYEGIKVVDARNGALTNNDSFVIGSGWGRGYRRDDGVMAVAGSDTAYAYTLARGPLKKARDHDAYNDNEYAYDWYLRSGQDNSNNSDDDNNNTGGNSGDGGNNSNGSNGGGSNQGGTGTDRPEQAKPYYGPSVPLYEAYPQVLLILNRLSTLQQRVGNRFWADGTDNMVNAGHLADQTSTLIEHSGFWGRMEGSRSKVTPSRSLTDEHYDLDLWRMQSGIDGALVETGNGILIGSLSGHLGRAEASVRSDDGHGKVEATGYGIGVAATWYGFNGSYVDLQSQATWYETDFNSKNFTRSDTKNENGFGYALSAEAGHRLKLTETWDITPQIQLSYSSIDFDSFRDGLNTKVSLKDGDSLEGRAGIAFSRDKTWISDSGDRRRTLLYGIGNLYYEFLDGTKVNVSGTSFRNENEDFQAGLGLGGSYNWNSDNWSLYGETNIRGAFKNVSDNYSFGGTVGLRIKF